MQIMAEGVVDVTTEGGVARKVVAVLLVGVVALNAGSRGTCPGSVARGAVRAVSTAKRKATCPESVPSQRF